MRRWRISDAVVVGINADDTFIVLIPSGGFIAVAASAAHHSGLKYDLPCIAWLQKDATEEVGRNAR